MKTLYVLLSIFSVLELGGQTKTNDYHKADSLGINLLEEYYFYQETTKDLVANLSNDKEKCRAIFRWICENIKYDFSVLNDYKKDGTDPIIVHVNKKAVCAGYASLFKTMCDEAGLNCLYITGTSKPDWIPHAWNMVRLDGTWYVMDVTWAAGSVGGILSGWKFKKAFNEVWWMIDYNKAVLTHDSENPFWVDFVERGKAKENNKIICFLKRLLNTV